jgi:hypothetical protein
MRGVWEENQDNATEEEVVPTYTQLASFHDPWKLRTKTIM